MAWGRNLEGQCGVESSVLVLRPTPILELHGAQLTSLHAGKLNSGAVTSGGEAWMWGDGGAGKLGHGSGDAVPAPHRVESLVGRAHVVGLALGDHHTLFADTSGALWACGENKEGQCGLGTPLEVIAAQHRRALTEAMRPLAREALAAEPRPSPEQRARAAISSLLGAGAALQQHATAPGGGMGAQQHAAASGRTGSWQALAASAGASAAGPGGGPGGRRPPLPLGGAGVGLRLDVEAALAERGLAPGQAATPLRIGRDQHPLAASAAKAGEMRPVLPSGLERQVVVAAAASRYFSAALTAAGEVWTWGACYNGSLGAHSSWSTAAQRVSGALAIALEEGGGATALASGGTFAAALTAAGRVVVWGKVPGGEGAGGGGVGELLGGAADGGGLGRALGLTEQDGVAGSGRVVAGVVPRLPRITHLAAGAAHLLMSDGRSVWQVGRAMDASGALAGSAHWRRPALVLRLPEGDEVAQLAAGVHSSGVVTARGEAWVWGRVLDRHHADAVARRHPHAAYGGAAEHVPLGGRAAPLVAEDVAWEWAGFGAREPARVSGLGCVKALALGGWHALAVVE